MDGTYGMAYASDGYSYPDFEPISIPSYGIICDAGSTITFDRVDVELQADPTASSELLWAKYKSTVGSAKLSTVDTSYGTFEIVWKNSKDKNWKVWNNYNGTNIYGLNKGHFYHYDSKFPSENAANRKLVAEEVLSNYFRN